MNIPKPERVPGHLRDEHQGLIRKSTASAKSSQLMFSAGETMRTAHLHHVLETTDCFSSFQKWMCQPRKPPRFYRFLAQKRAILQFQSPMLISKFWTLPGFSPVLSPAVQNNSHTETAKLEAPEFLKHLQFTLIFSSFLSTESLRWEVFWHVASWVKINQLKWEE